LRVAVSRISGYVMFTSGICKEFVAHTASICVAAVVAAACRANAPSAHVEPNVARQAAAASDADGQDRLKSCEAQAARLAARTIRRENREGPPRWEAHYSRKYDQCYVRIDRIVASAAAGAIVSELWEAFDAALLAVHSTDGSDAATRSFCQVSLSDDPFTSCMVSKFFIDEHMQH
jgi:hypothetical protein